MACGRRGDHTSLASTCTGRRTVTATAHWSAELPPVKRRASRREWVRCAPEDRCPKPEVVPVHDHPLECGYAVRRVGFWWDRHKRWYALHELTDGHLQGVVMWLSKHAHRLWQEELDDDRFHVPCPALAYEDHIAWMKDTPLTHALEKELARRALPAAATQPTTEPAESARGGHAGKN